MIITSNWSLEERERYAYITNSPAAPLLAVAIGGIEYQDDTLRHELDTTNDELDQCKEELEQAKEALSVATVKLEPQIRRLQDQLNEFKHLCTV